MPAVQWSLVCDYCLVDQGGRLSLIGIYDRLFVPQLPVICPLLHVVTQWRVAEPSFRMEVRLWTPTEQVLSTSGEVHVGPVPGDQHTTISRFVNLTFERPGQYLVEVLANGETERYYPLQLVVQPLPAPPIMPPPSM